MLTKFQHLFLDYGQGQAGRRRTLWVVGLWLMLFAVFAPLVLAQGGDVLSAPPQTYELVQGWYKDRETFYYDFGANTPATADGQGAVTAPIYVLITGFDANGNPQVVEGQHNIVDVIPGDEGYSDLWEVTFVTVPADYEADSITSADEVLNGGFEMTVPGVYVNCPIVPAGSTLAEEDAPLVQGWYKGQAVYYFDFGPTDPVTAPIYALVTGFDADGNPQFVEGQHNVVDVIPGDEGYSPFWYVNLVIVPEDYEANSITSVDEVLASGYEIVQPGLLVNCPIVRTAEVAAPGALPTTGGAKVDLTLWSLVAGGLVFGAGLALRRKLASQS